MDRKQTNKIFLEHLTITSFRISFDINHNPILTIFNDINCFNLRDEANFFQYEPDDYFDDEIALNCEINKWRKDYFLFLEKNIDDPNKTEINI